MSSNAWFGGILLSLAAVLAPAAQAADKQVIEKAVARGVDYLKQGQLPDGSWPHMYSGATALAGLALLEGGVPANDPAVQRAAVFLRKESLTLTHTYSLALCNMFFDRLDDPGDVPLIESITVRLLAGQSSQGGWSYQCPAISAVEERRLSTHLRKQVELVGRRDLPKPPVPKRTPNDLPREIRDQLARLANRQMGNAPAAGFDVGQMALLSRDDNSNTQFALLGLWVSRKHGLPVDWALARAEQRFRLTQNRDGGWGYLASGPMMIGAGSTPAMTCAGLIGLGTGYGATGEAVLRTDVRKPAAAAPARPRARNLAADRAVQAGLVLLATAIGQPRPRLGGIGPQVNFPPGLPGAGGNAPDYYYLWSLERVAMIFDLKTIGGKDWYRWGAEVLLENQDATGGWTGKYAEGGVDTCFALLFLCRSNVAQDLTSTLRGQLRNPGEAQLRAGVPRREPEKKQPPVQPGPRSGDSAAAKVPLQKATASPPARRQEPRPLASSRPEPAAVPTRPNDQTREVQRLASALLRAPADRQREVLQGLVEGKGSVHTEALASAIPQLTGEAKQRVRDGLAKRLARMTAPTLRDKLRGKDAEVRRAAALAVELKGDRQHIPDLIALLEDPEPTVVRAAYAALREMTRQDFGPDARADTAERRRAAERWQAWWARQKSK